MKHNYNRRVLLSLYAVAASAMLLTGFTSLAAENDRNADQSTYIQDEIFQWDFAGTAGGIRGEAVQDTKEAVNAAHTAYLIRVEEERKAAEEAQRIAEEQASRRGSGRSGGSRGTGCKCSCFRAGTARRADLLRGR